MYCLFHRYIFDKTLDLKDEYADWLTTFVVSSSAICVCSNDFSRGVNVLVSLESRKRLKLLCPKNLD